jgi:Ca2+-transporting ATPase
MIDAPRVEAYDAIALCHQAGIKTIMITGDHKNTAVAIAKELNLLSADELAITGKELDSMSESEYLSKINKIKVYARVSPENKVRIVTSWQSLGEVVAMTGDGVNDAPAIKKADIGISMGLTGTEVAKGSADMILTDDNFATIVTAVSEGRTIFANIKKAIFYLLSCNVAEILSVFLGQVILTFLITDFVGLFTATQLLWVNLVTDSLMAIALGLELKEKDIMNKPPRDTSKTIFAGGFGKRIIEYGIILGLVTFGSYLTGYYLALSMGHTNPLEEGATMAFMVLAISQLFHAFNCRSENQSIFKLKINKWLIFAFITCLLLQLITVLPGINQVFGVTSIADIMWWEWFIIFGFCLTLIIVIEIQKLIKNFISKRKTS